MCDPLASYVIDHQPLRKAKGPIFKGIAYGIVNIHLPGMMFGKPITTPVLERNIPFALLEVNYSVWNKTTMSSASTSPNAHGITVISV
jgi:hypothetical protein